MIGKATIFISHAWKYNFMDVINVIKSIDEVEKGHYFWFDLVNLLSYIISSYTLYYILYYITFYLLTHYIILYYLVLYYIIVFK